MPLETSSQKDNYFFHTVFIKAVKGQPNLIGGGHHMSMGEVSENLKPSLIRHGYNQSVVEP